MPNLGGWEFVILIGVLVLLFGAKRLPDMARSIGQSARVFKGEMKGMKGDDGAEAKNSEPPVPPVALPRTDASPPPAAPTTPATTSVDTPPEPAPVPQPGRSNTGQ